MTETGLGGERHPGEPPRTSGQFVSKYKKAPGRHEATRTHEVTYSFVYCLISHNRDQLFELGHLSRVGCLIPQHPYMVRQAATVNIVRPFTQEVEHLRKSKRH